MADDRFSPKEIHWLSLSGDASYAVLSTDGRVVAHFRPDRLQPSWDSSKAVALNNANLFIAAPDLLDMLIACVDSQECNGYIGVQTMREARAAIAKAEGKNS